MSYGEKITQLRKKNGMTQAELGAKLNVTYQAVSKWERDESEPDFATMSKMARIFGVGLSYFEESEIEPAEPGATEPAPEKAEEAPAEPPKEKKKIAGMCTSCGRVLHEGEDNVVGGKLVCAACAAKARAAAKAAAEKSDAERRAYAQEASTMRNRGLIWGTVAAGICLAITIIAIACADSKGATAAGWLVVTVLSFFTVSQLFWDGVVADIATVGGKVVGTPGIIFSFDFDGFIFLIAMKILFAVLRMLVYVITFMFFVVIAAIISPFTFVPCLMRVNREIEGRRNGTIKRFVGGRGSNKF